MISHHHETVFVHIPKCGGQSIEHMFLEDIGLDWQRRAPLLLRRNSNPKLGPPRLAHLLARDYVDLGHISKDKFDSYFKFAIVRDPYKRVISMYNYLNVLRPSSKLLTAIFGGKSVPRLLGGNPLTLDDFIFGWLPDQFSSGDERGEKSNYWFVRKQFDYIFDVEGAPMLEHIIRLEELNSKVDELRSRCRLSSSLGHVNKSISKVSSKDFLPGHLDVIEELYSDDFDSFGYARIPR